MGRLRNLFNKLLRKQPSPAADSIPIPPSWPGGKPGEDLPTRPKLVHLGRPKKPFKIRVPGLRHGKRILAGILLAVNFLLSQATLLGPTVTLPIALFFFANAFICLDYIWKTRRKTKIEQ